jgi:hypothetical protein
MSYEFQDEREYEIEPARGIGQLRNNRRTATVIYIVLALIGSIGGGAAFLWSRHGGALNDFAIFKSETAPQAVSLKVFDEYQQAVAANLRRDHEMLQAQDAEIRQLSDQVLLLAFKIDTLASRGREAQAAIPPVPVPKVAPKRRAAKPPLSTGGSPLFPAPEEKQ